MGSVDQSDYFVSNYQTLKLVKWYRKLLLYLINMVVLSSYILNKKYGETQMTYTSYREYIANYLISTLVKNAQLLWKTVPQILDNSQLQLTGRHFICKIKCLDGAKRKTPACRCHVYNFAQQQLAHYCLPLHKLPKKISSFGCGHCENITLCITPCFKIYHTILNYREEGARTCVNNIAMWIMAILVILKM